MKTSRSRRITNSCLLSLGTLFMLLVLGLTTGKFYTDHLLREAQSDYPPAEFVTVETIRLHYVRAGVGRPVVIIPGGGGKVQDFTLSPLFEPLIDNYEVFVFDRPGLGYSEQPAEDATPAVQARLIHGTLQTLGIEQPVIIGQSWGGVIALQAALDYPSDIAGLVLLGTAPYPEESYPDDWFYTLARQPVVGDFVLSTVWMPLGRHVVGPAQLDSDSMLGYFAPLESVPDSYYHSTLALNLRPSHSRTAAFEDQIIPPAMEDLSQRLPNVSVPVLIVAGELDDHVVEQIPQLKADLPLARVQLVEDANHYLWFAYPDEVITALADLWQWIDEQN